MPSSPCQAKFPAGVNSELFYPWCQSKFTSARAYEQQVLSSEKEEFSTSAEWGLGEVKAEDERSSTGWCDFSCSHRGLQSQTERVKTNTNFLSSLVSSKARREKEAGKDWRRLKSKGWSTSPLVFGRLAWQLGIRSASMKGRAQDQCVSHYAAAFQCRKCVKYEVKVQATERAFWMYAGQ